MNYITLPSSSSVDMLRFRLKYRGEPGEAFEWFDKFWADVKIEFGNPNREEPNDKWPVRYPRSLRMGTYREMVQIPVGDTSIQIAIGRNGKGDKSELKEGFLEFNPAKTYPSKQLEFVYRQLERTPEITMELVRWDFATDYPLARERFALMRDRRMYQSNVRESFTEYLGTRHKNGYVKLYDKQKELIHQGKQQDEPLTRLEITIEEKPGKQKWEAGGAEIPVNEWPRVVCVPEKVPEGASGQTALVIMAWVSGNPLENCLQYVKARSRTRIRDYIAEECGLVSHPRDYDRCRKHALAWANRYGGLMGATDSD